MSVESHGHVWWAAYRWGHSSPQGLAVSLLEMQAVPKHTESGSPMHAHWTDIHVHDMGPRHLPRTSQALSNRTVGLIRIYNRCIPPLEAWIPKHPHPSHSRPIQQLTTKLYHASVGDTFRSKIRGSKLVEGIAHEQQNHGNQGTTSIWKQMPVPHPSPVTTPSSPHPQPHTQEISVGCYTLQIMPSWSEWGLSWHAAPRHFALCLMLQRQ